MGKGLSFTVPIRTSGSLNSREHWAVKAKRVKAERSATMAAWYGAWAVAKNGRQAPHGRVYGEAWTVTLTRIAPRQMDGDNLQGALKGVRDEVAARLGVDDGDARVTWRYGQERGRPREYAVRVEVGPGDGATAVQDGSGDVCSLGARVPFR